MSGFGVQQVDPLVLGTDPDMAVGILEHRADGQVRGDGGIAGVDDVQFEIFGDRIEAAQPVGGAHPQASVESFADGCALRRRSSRWPSSGSCLKCRIRPVAGEKRVSPSVGADPDQAARIDQQALHLVGGQGGRVVRVMDRRP